MSAAVAYAALIVVIRGAPSLATDDGIFLTVAGRLLDGDQLYVDVLDNKDPLFYYTYAGALAFGDWRLPFVLDIVWVALGAVSTALFLRAVGATRLTTVLGFLAYPVLLTWTWYLAGYSMLAALALAPLIAWLWVRGNFAVAGALVAAGILFKLNLVFVLASAPLALLLLRVPSASARTQLTRAIAGFVGILALVAAVMALRGELSGYLDVLGDNSSYSRDVLEESDRPGGILGHLLVATQGEDDEPWEALRLLEAALVVGCVLAVVRLWKSRPTREASTADVLAAVLVSAAAAATVTLALTAVWFHHSQMLAYPALLLVVFLVTVLQDSAAGLARPLAACTAVVAAFALAWDAANRDYFDPSSAWRESGESETADVLEAAADELGSEPDEITFAHLGQNDERGVGAFLDDRFALACRDVAQYSFHPDGSVLDCIREERPRLIFVTPSFHPIPTAEEEWNDLVADAATFVTTEYKRIARDDTDIGPVEVWATR